MPVRSLLVRTAAAVCVACLLLPGCAGPGGAAAGPVPVAPPRPGQAASQLCTRLGGRLPARLDGQARRAVRPRSPFTAAWGDPPIALRCGVPLPAALAPTAELTVVNGVFWFTEPVSSATPSRFTEVGRQAYVEVTVPARYGPAGPILVAISDAIAAAVPAKPGGGI